MNYANYAKLQTRAAKLQAELGEIKQQLEEFRLETLRRVEIKRNNSSTTLLFNGRRLNVTRGTWPDRVRIKENGKTVTNDFFGNVHDVRFAVALGQL